MAEYFIENLNRKNRCNDGLHFWASGCNGVIFNAALARGCARQKQNTFQKRRFATGVGTHNGNVSDAGGTVTFHENLHGNENSQ